MSSTKSLLDILPAPKSNENIFKPRQIPNTTITQSKLSTPSSRQISSNIPKTVSSDVSNTYSTAIITSKPVSNTSITPSTSKTSIKNTANYSKIQKTNQINFFGLGDYGSDTDDEEEKLEKNEPHNDYYQQESITNHVHDANPPISEILKYENKKRRLDNSAINFVDVNVKDVIEKNKEQLLKNLTTEPVKPGRTVVGTGRKHHQITYLAMMAKEREQELNKQWSENKFNRKLSKQKYGF